MSNISSSSNTSVYQPRDAKEVQVLKNINTILWVTKYNDNPEPNPELKLKAANFSEFLGLKEKTGIGVRTFGKHSIWGKVTACLGLDSTEKVKKQIANDRNYAQGILPEEVIKDLDNAIFHIESFTFLEDHASERFQNSKNFEKNQPTGLAVNSTKTVDNEEVKFRPNPPH